jgi:hypothetical protein
METLFQLFQKKSTMNENKRGEREIKLVMFKGFRNKGVSQR